MNVDGGDSHGSLQDVHDARRERRRIVLVADRGADEDELVAAEAGHRVGGAYHGRQPARDFLQKFIAGTVSQGIVDELEAVEIANQQRKRAHVAVGMRDGLLQAVVQQDAIRQARQCIVGGQMPQLLIRGFQAARARRDHLFEAQHMLSDQLVVFPFAAQRRGALQNLDRFGGFAQHQQLVGVAEPLHHLGPVVVGMGRTDDHLHVGIRRPQALDGFQAVPARRHAHVDERHRIRTTLGERLVHHRDAFLALMRRVDVEVRPRRRGYVVAEQICFQHIERGLRRVLGLGAQDLAKIRMNGRIVVDDQNAPVAERSGVRHGRPPRGLQGSSRMNMAPRPGPSLVTRSEPPSSWAASAPLCKPKPCPRRGS